MEQSIHLFRLTPSIPGDRITAYWENGKRGEVRKMASSGHDEEILDSAHHEEIPSWQRQAWLTEYQVCQQHVNSAGSEVWVSTTIFLTINVTLLGGLFYSFMTRVVLDKPDLEGISLALKVVTFIGFTALGVGILCILKQWVNWLERMKFKVAVDFERMRELEASLGMRRHTMGRELELEDDALRKSERDARSKEARKKARERIQEFEERVKHLPFFRPGGYDRLIRIARIVMGLWCVFILAFWAVAIILFLQGSQLTPNCMNSTVALTI
ncbi:hypothetical protein ACFLW7_02115 [Chloroflexota bacterium]